MTLRFAPAVVAAASLIVLARTGSADDRVFPSHDVAIQLAIGTDGTANVTERYALRGPIGRTAFQFLADPCAIVGPVSASIDDRVVAWEPDRDVRAPWTSLHIELAGAPIAAGTNFYVRYVVYTRGTRAVVPVIMPAAALESMEGARGARVDVVVRWNGPRGAAQVAMPRLEPASPSDTWVATLLAIPSSIRLDRLAAAADTCDRQVAGTTGGLGWRVAVFVGIMATWVPAYLWWSGRRWSADS